uniref:Chromophore lyase CpcS/CpeS n=1 Tax=Gelidium gabrielsonii TaxID=2483892 RepID=A0A3G2QX77_9FLOR|nr:hypothetical protein [Gelidium gabrielsonii]AYO27662.1 hypothetical protein [Gelidium gabrielsonii]
MLSLNKFIEKLQGKWYSNQTIYFISSKKIKNYRNTMIFKKNFFKEDNLKQYNSAHIIYEKLASENSAYSYTILSDNCIKILSESKTYNIKYIEYIYSISQNFRISIVYIKNLQKCLAVSFNSYIKQTHYLD